MKKLSYPQFVIFSSCVLVALFITVILLLGSNSRLQASNSEYLKKLTFFQDAEQQRQIQASKQTSRLAEMGGQQQEMMGLVKELQEELDRLQLEYQRSIETSKQTSSQLQLVSQQKSQLSESIERQQQLITEANNTIISQQKLIQQLSKGAIAPSTRQEDIRNFIAVLNKLITSSKESITMTESQDQSVSIDIPNNLLFVDGDVAFVDTAPTLLEEVSKALATLNNVELNVIGHADARPIVSDLRFRFPNNWALSSARASLVVSELVNNGLPEGILTASGKAANAPIREADNAESWQINRRVQIVVKF